MDGAQIIISDTEVNAGIDRVAAAGGDTGGLMEAIAGYMLFSVQRRFETETGPDGKAWTPLSPRTVSKRVSGKRRRGSQNILRVKNRLYSSITGEAEATEARVGTNLIYAAIHQTGGTIDKPARNSSVRLRKVKGRTRFAKKAHKRARDVDVTIKAHTITIPARPYLGFSEADKTELLKITEDYLREASGGALQ